MVAVCVHSQCSQIFYTVYGEFVFVLEFWVNGSTLTKGARTMLTGPV